MEAQVLSPSQSTSLPQRLAGFLRSELAPFPGRTEAVIRQTLAVALCMIISYSLQVPFLVLSVIIVFFTQQANQVLTKMVGLFLSLGFILVNALAILMMDWTFDYPSLRMAMAGTMVFLGMWFFRISPIAGSMGYMGALSLVFSQSFYAELPYPELMLRVTLWTIPAGVYAALLTIAINYLVLPADPRRELFKELARQAGAAAEQLESLLAGRPGQPIHRSDLERGVTALTGSLRFALMADRKLARERTRLLALINNTSRLYLAAYHLAHQAAGGAPSPARAEGLRLLAEEVRRFQAQTERNEPYRLSPEFRTAKWAEAGGPSPDPNLAEIAAALRDQDQAADLAPEDRPAAKPPVFRPDAFTNPVYLRFAFKTMLATMFCYIFYTALDWDGIHTCMLTCIIIALPSLGEVSQKAILRLAGCAVGSLITLVAVIVVVPHLDSLAGIMLLTLPVIALGAWINAGSPRLNYAGMQIVFAYALALLEKYGPSYELTEIRDRLIGIVVGVIVYTLVSTLFWPEKEEVRLRQTLAELLRCLARLARTETGPDTGPSKNLAAAQTLDSCYSLLARAREMRNLVRLQPDWSYGQPEAATGSQWPDRAQELVLGLRHLNARSAALAESGRAEDQSLRAEARDFSAGLARRLDHYADQLAKPRPGPEGDGAPPKVDPAESGGPATGPPAAPLAEPETPPWPPLPGGEAGWRAELEELRDKVERLGKEVTGK